QRRLELTQEQRYPDRRGNGADENPGEQDRLIGSRGYDRYLRRIDDAELDLVGSCVRRLANSRLFAPCQQFVKALFLDCVIPVEVLRLRLHPRRRPRLLLYFFFFRLRLLLPSLSRSYRVPALAAFTLHLSV